MKNTKIPLIPVTLILVVLFMACYLIVMDIGTSSKKDADETVETETEEISAQLTKDDTAVVIYRDTDDKILNFQSVASGKRYALYYDGTTSAEDQYGEVMSVAQIPIGEIVDLTYSAHAKIVQKMAVSTNTWTYTNIVKFSFDRDKKVLQLPDEKYMYTDDLIVASGDHAVELMDINEQDTLTIKGYNRMVTSVIIEKGHGYIRLLNDEYFVGGWVEVGQSIIKPISSEMLLIVPEGDYHVRLTNEGNTGEVDVTVARDKETEIDLAEIEIEKVITGMLSFIISPAYAELEIDGKPADYSDLIELSYGVHQIVVESMGYKTLTKNIKIGAPLAEIEIELEEEGDDSSSSSSSSSHSSSSPATTISSTVPGTSELLTSLLNQLTSTSTSSSSTSSSSTSSSSGSSSSSSTVTSAESRVYIDGPESAEVYLDGTYVGIAPCNFKKVTGTHVITLRASGYQTKSYTVDIADDGNSISFSFSALVTGVSE